MKPNITFYNHLTHPTWVNLYNKMHAENGRTNGAYTYSVDISKFYFPVIRELCNKFEYKNILVNSISILKKRDMPKNTDLLIQFLHESAEREIPRIKILRTYYKGKAIFVTYKQSIAREIKEIGEEIIVIPPAVDVAGLSKYQSKNRYNDRRAIWFGNKYLNKYNTYDDVKAAFESKGYIFDTLKDNRINNGEVLSRNRLLKELAKYRIGIGVGRCILEMNALGITTMTSGTTFGGIFTSYEEFDIQKNNNFSIGEATYSSDINYCIDNLNKAIIKTIDCEDVKDILRKELKKVM